MNVHNFVLAVFRAVAKGNSKPFTIKWGYRQYEFELAPVTQDNQGPVVGLWLEENSIQMFLWKDELDAGLDGADEGWLLSLSGVSSAPSSRVFIQQGKASYYLENPALIKAIASVFASIWKLDEMVRSQTPVPG